MLECIDERYSYVILWNHLLTVGLENLALFLSCDVLVQSRVEHHLVSKATYHAAHSLTETDATQQKHISFYITIKYLNTSNLPTS